MQVSTKTLLCELKWVQRFIEKKTSIPVLANVKFEARDGRLELTSTDLEIAGLTSLPGHGDDAWTVTAPIRHLIKYLDKVDDDGVTLSTKAHWLHLTHSGAATRVAGMSNESYPELPKAPPTQAILSQLSQSIERTVFAISAEETRFTLNGALLEIDENEGRMIATDGHRLSLAPVQVKSEEKIKALLPKKTLVEAANLDGDCQFSRDADHVFLNFGQRRIVSRVLTGNFPDWQRVMVKEFPGHAMLPVTATLKTIERVAIYADERSRCVRFTFEDDKLTIFASSVETGEANGTVTVKPGEWPAPPPVKPAEGLEHIEEIPLAEPEKKFEMGLNADYVTDFLSRTAAQFVAFCWKDKKSMIMLTHPSGWQYGVMPMRMD